MGDQSVKQRAKKALNGVELAHLGTAKKRSSKSIPGGKGVHKEEVPENPKDKWYPKKLPESDVVYLARKKREQASNEKRIQKQKAERLKIENEKAQQLREERVKQAQEARIEIGSEKYAGRVRDDESKCKGSAGETDPA